MEKPMRDPGSASVPEDGPETPRNITLRITIEENGDILLPEAP